MVLILIYELPLLFYYLCDWIVYEQFFWVKIQDVFSLVSIDEFTSAVRGYKNSQQKYRKYFLQQAYTNLFRICVVIKIQG